MSLDNDRLSKAHVVRLAGDMCLTLKLWMDGQAPLDFSQEVGHIEALIDRFPKSSTRNRHKYEWTSAIFVYFKHLAINPKRIGFGGETWECFPKERPYRGEFLTDFAIWEAGYGLRISCESQSDEGAKNKIRVEAAIDKLLHVKADIKVLIFEDKHSDGTLFDHLRSTYMQNYVRFAVPEDYLFFQWDNAEVKAYHWFPTDGGKPQLLDL